MGPAAPERLVTATVTGLAVVPSDKPRTNQPTWLGGASHPVKVRMTVGDLTRQRRAPAAEPLAREPGQAREELGPLEQPRALAREDL